MPRINCLDDSVDAAKAAANRYPAIGGALIVAGLIASNVFGYDGLLCIGIPCVLCALSWVYSFGIREGASYIPTQADIERELRQIVAQAESPVTPKESLP